MNSHETATYEVVEFDSLSDTVKSMLRQAAEMRKRAYCPYSNFAVGATLLTEADSKMYSGCNIENAAFSPSMCAERTAIAKAVTDGYLSYTSVAIIAHQQSFTAPCGVCRQSLCEFVSTSGDMDIYLSKPAMNTVLCTKLSKMLPLSFVNYKDSIVS